MSQRVGRCLVNTTACKRPFSLGCVAHNDGAALQGERRQRRSATLWWGPVSTTACKRLFSLGCVPHTDGAVLQALRSPESTPR